MRKSTTQLTRTEKLIETYYRPMFHFAVRLCGSPEKAMILTQRTFRQAFERGNDLPAPGNARPWLVAILFSEFLAGHSNIRPV